MDRWKHVPFWGAPDLERKLRQFRDYYNHGRVHASLKGVTPILFNRSQRERSGRLPRVISIACGRVSVNSPHTGEVVVRIGLEPVTN